MSGKPANERSTAALRDEEQPAVSPPQAPLQLPRSSRPPPLPASVVGKFSRQRLPDSVAMPRRVELKGSIRIRIPSTATALPPRPSPPPPPLRSRQSQPPPPPQPRPRPSRPPSPPSAAESEAALADAEVDLAIDSAVSAIDSVHRSGAPSIDGPGPGAAAIDSAQRGGAPPAETSPPGEDPGAVDDSLLQVLLDTVRLQSERRLESRGEIGRGGMGAVTEEFDALLQRPTAKKTLLDQVRGLPAVVRAFIREAQITGQLDHPNIVPVHDLGIDERGCLFFTMKRVVGRNLGEILEDDDDNCFVDARNDRMCARMEIMVKVCDALAFAHSRGVLHCDVKAQNVMVGDYGQVYLMDWGFAQLLPPRPGRRHVEDILPYLAQRRERFVLGTPGYMSPEQARGEVLDERADVFSMGALMYLILTGRLLYSAPTPIEAILMAQRGEFTALDEGTGAMALIPGELARIVNRATAKDRAERYASVDELRADLQQFLRGGSSMPARRVPAGTVIVREGAAGDEAYIIMSGECEVYTGSGADRVTLKTLGPGQVFGEMALLAGAQRMATVVARTDVQVVVVDRQVIEQEVRSMKPWMGAFLQSFTARFRELQQHSESQRSKSSVDERPWWRLKWW